MAGAPWGTAGCFNVSSDRELSVATVAPKPHSVAKESQAPGIALLPEVWMSQVAIMGVKPPKVAVAKLYASEKPEVRTSAGMISVRNGIIAPFQQPQMKESHSSTMRSLVNEGSRTSHDIAG